MSSYHTFLSARATEPDPATLLTRLRALDATAGVQHTLGTAQYVVKKATAWTTQQINQAQTEIDTAPPQTPQSLAQAEIDRWPISTRALVLTLIDQINVLRAGLPQPLAPITPTQALQAIRSKAGEISAE